MRLKQTLGVLLSLLILSALAAAAGSQLTNIRVAGQGSETTVILHASGAFNHTEYRPTDNLLLVDLSGVAAGKLKDSAQTVNRPGLASYHVVDYTGASGAPVTRVEMALTAGAVVTVSESQGDLTVRIAGSKEASAAPAPAASH